MKTLFLFALTSILALNLNARENPFETTNVFEEEVGKIVDMDEKAVKKSMEDMPYIKEMQEKMSNVSSQGENKNKVEDNAEKMIPAEQKTYSKKEVDTLIQKTQKQTEQKAKELVKKEVQKTAEPTQVVYVKPRSDTATDDETLLTKNILPFIKLEFNDNKLIINTTHPVSKKFSVDKENKLIIDYKAKIEFNTKTDTLESKNFKRVSIGNHKNEGYFRIAIELIDKPSKYDVNYADESITISKIH